MRTLKNGSSAKCAGSTRVSQGARQLAAQEQEGVRQNGLQIRNQRAKQDKQQQNEPLKAKGRGERPG